MQLKQTWIFKNILLVLSIIIILVVFLGWKGIILIPFLNGYVKLISPNYNESTVATTSIIDKSIKVSSSTVVNSTFNTGDVYNTGGLVQINNDQRKNIIDTLIKSKNKVKIINQPGDNSRKLAKQLASIFSDAGWDVDYNFGAFSISYIGGNSVIAVEVSDINNPSAGAKQIFDALKSASFPFPVGYHQDSSVNKLVITVGDF